VAPTGHGSSFDEGVRGSCHVNKRVGTEGWADDSNLLHPAKKVY